jgi:hypothetical protein
MTWVGKVFQSSSWPHWFGGKHILPKPQGSSPLKLDPDGRAPVDCAFCAQMWPKSMKKID